MTNDKHWYVAYVKSCQERKAAELLSALGYTHYLPIQRELRQWSDRKKLCERLVLPRLIFVYCTAVERVKTLEEVSCLYRYMSNKGPYNPVVVPDNQMEAFMTMVEHGPRTIEVVQQPIAPGDKVKVVSGPLAGCECEVVSVSGKRCYAVRLGTIGTATMDLALDSVNPL